MIITVVTETYNPDVNGVAMTLGKLVYGLALAGNKIQLVIPSNKVVDINVLELPDNVSVHHVKGIPIPRYTEAKFGLPSARKIKKIWEQERPDVIYVATEGPLGWSAIRLANKVNIPSISGFHTNFHSYSCYYGIGLVERMVKKYLVSLHNKSNLTLTPTTNQKNILIDMGIANVDVLSRGVDTELFSPTKRCLQLRVSWGVWYDHEPVMLYVGRLAVEKNIDLAIDTYHEMRKRDNKLKFVLVGDGPLFAKLQHDNPDFIFVGMKKGEELAKYYASCDIFVFPSITETFGNVVLEAMASGLGVVAYDYAAANMHVHHGINGMLASYNDSHEFIEKACGYLNNYVYLNAIKTKAAKYASLQRWDGIIQKFESLLTEQAYRSFNNYLVDETQSATS